jgi:diguanylate cyclase (GGDEF)-like protein/PAS domain S-box-containing protein
MLRGAAGLFNATQSVSRDEFRDYVESLRLDEAFPGIQSVGFTLLIPAKDRARHEEQVRREGFPQYAIRPTGERDPYTSLVYVEPFSGPNPRSFGLDVYAEPVRRAAMERARDENATALSGKVTFAQETPTTARTGFVMYRPVYRRGAPRESLDQRRAGLVGWVGAAFRTDDLMRGILREEFGKLSAAFDIELFEGDGASPTALFYASGEPAGTAGAQRRTSFKALRRVELAGTTWTVAVHSLPAFESRLRPGKSALIAIAGGTATLLLALLISRLLSTRARALRAATEMNRELSERKRAEAALRASEERWSFAVEGTGAGVWDWHLRTGQVQFSRLWKEMYLYAEDEIGSSYDEWETRIHPEDLQQAKAALKKFADGKTATYANEYRMHCKDGSWKWILDRGMVVSRDADGKPLRIIGTHTDVTEKKRDEELVWRQANYDALTGLPNRRLFRDRLQEKLKKARRTGRPVALLFVDLDRFKEVNDSLGHASGDLLLKQAAKRISACLREADTTARLGGDEFIVMVSDLPDTTHVERVVQAIVRALAEPFRLDDETATVTASVGIAFYPGDAADGDTLLSNADEAMYAAKLRGRNCYSYFAGPKVADAQK